MNNPYNPYSAYAPCPQCRASMASPVSYTWWGGFIGPRLMSHVRCGACGSAYNGKSGKPNTTAIAVYFVVVLALAIMVGIFANSR